jgi:hypothetical protein
MTTRKSFYWSFGSEEKIMTNWAVRFQTLFSTFVRLQGLVHTSITSHAMEVINPQPFSKSADVAIRTMVYSSGKLKK